MCRRHEEGDPFAQQRTDRQTTKNSRLGRQPGEASERAPMEETRMHSTREIRNDLEDPVTPKTPYRQIRGSG